MAIFQSHLHNRTSAFTLPSPRKEQQHQQQQQQSPCEGGPATPLHPIDSYEEFQSQDPQAPSLPWLVNYWSSSCFKAPALLFDQICSCSSAAEPPKSVYSTNDSFNSNSQTNTYFDDTVLRSDPKVDRSPTRISPTRWDALRSVVASHADYTIEDYCDFAELMPCEEKEENNDNDNSRYPTSKTKKSSRNQCRRSSILADNSKDEDVAMDMDCDLDQSEEMKEDIRMKPPASPTTQSESSIFRNSTQASHSRNHSGKGLNTCHSSDQYIDTTRYLCAEGPSTPPTTPPRWSPPSTSLHDRHRSRQASLMQTTLTPRTLSFQRLAIPNTNASRKPPSPSQSVADTYTTISLSHSFAREFEEDNKTWSESASLTSSSRSPFRRCQPRTILSEHNDYGEIKQEDSEDLENMHPSTPPRTRKLARNEGDDDDLAFPCLVRMSPDNYKHGKTVSDEDWCYESPVSNASSSVLLPLHPHQRIIALLPHDSEDADTDVDHSGYTCFRGMLLKDAQRQRVASPVASDI